MYEFGPVEPLKIVVDQEADTVICINFESPELLISYVEQFIQESWKGVPALVCHMPCGHEVTYEKLEDIPKDSVPCTCGNPKHWFLKYSPR